MRMIPNEQKKKKKKRNRCRMAFIVPGFLAVTGREPLEIFKTYSGTTDLPGGRGWGEWGR